MIVAVAVCPNEAVLLGETFRLTKVFARTLPLAPMSYVHLVSADPLVVDVDDSNHGALRVFDRTGRQTRVVSAHRHGATLDLSPRPEANVREFADRNREFPFVVSGQTLVAPTARPQDGAGKPDTLMGVDLGSGADVWSRTLPWHMGFMLGASPDPATTVYGFYEGGDTTRDLDPRTPVDAPPQTFTADPRTGAVHKGAALDPGTSALDLGNTGYQQVFVAERTTILVGVGHLDDDAPLVAAYGT